MRDYTHVRHRHISELTHEEIRQLDILNLREHGLMQGEFRNYLYCLDYLKENPKKGFMPDAHAFMILSKHTDYIVAWAFVFPGCYYQQRPEGPWDVYIYTHPSHRRRGLGGKIIRKICRQMGKSNIYIHPHDDQSEKFYVSLKMMNNPDLIVEHW